MLACVAASAHAGPKVVVLGFDGADSVITEKLMAEGRLPNLSKLASEGGYWPLLPTNPPQTPVSWSTFATGLNPGKTEIFDFIKKQGRDYRPALCAGEEGTRPFVFGEWNPLVFAAVGAGLGLVPLLFALAYPGVRRKLLRVGVALLLMGVVGGYAFATTLVPERVPRAVNNRKGVTFWELAARAGLKARIIRVPVTFPADVHENLVMLSGLGVPDVRGNFGQPTLYTTREGLSGGQFSVKVVAMPTRPEQAQDLVVEGPRNVLFPRGDGKPAERITTDLRLTQHAGGDVTVDCGDRESRLAPGAWSDWHVIQFAFNPIVAVRGMARFYNQSDPGGAKSEVLMSPIHFHPDEGGKVGFSQPHDHAKDLARRIGLFKTMGWSIDTWTVSAGLTTDQQCLEDALFTADGVEQLMRAQLADPEIDLYVQVFSFTDRIQHIFWRLTEPEHPGYDAELARQHAGVIDDAYERMDRIVGEARKLAPADATFFVLSDHGFSSFRRGVNLNRWLVDNGYMVLREDPCVGGTGGQRSLDDLFEDTSGIFSEVDWSRTRAYAMGLGNLYVNLAGREALGVVRPGAEYDELCANLAAGLEALVDAKTGERPVARVYRRDQIYTGYDPELIPDLRVANNHGYRVSWDTTLGGIPCEQVVDNDKAWGADHCSLDPELVKGILLCNKPLSATRPEMADAAPTILEALGLPPPPDADGRSLL